MWTCGQRMPSAGDTFLCQGSLFRPHVVEHVVFCIGMKGVDWIWHNRVDSSI